MKIFRKIKKKKKNEEDIKSFLRYLNIPKLSEDKSKLCEEYFSEKDFNISQRQAIIKLIKKDRAKRFIKNWRPTSFLNVDLKIILKALSEKRKFYQM